MAIPMSEEMRRKTQGWAQRYGGATSQANKDYYNALSQDSKTGVKQSIIESIFDAGAFAKDKFIRGAEGGASELNKMRDETASVDNEKIKNQQNTARQLELLRQGLGQQRLAGQQSLRHSLAGRGMLGSGAEWRGMSDINNQMGNLMAQGTMKAAMGETDRLMELEKEARDRNFQREMMQTQIREQMKAEQRNKPEWWEYLLGGLGQVGVGAVTNWLSPASAASSGLTLKPKK